MKEDFRIEILKKLLEIIKENNEEIATVTRDEVSDIKKAIRFYEIGKQFILKEIGDIRITKSSDFPSKISDFKEFQEFKEE